MIANASIFELALETAELDDQISANDANCVRPLVVVDTPDTQISANQNNHSPVRQAVMNYLGVEK
jgi:hypothetical protein